MKAYGSGCIDPYFLDLGTSRRLVVNFMNRPLYHGERAPTTHWIGGWVDLRAALDDLEKRVAARSKARNVFTRRNIGIVGLHPTRDIDVCLRSFCVCAVQCR
jgi:hypothetical protein